MAELPIFPLNTVLFPGGALPLRIFEPRYLDMVSECLKQQHGFGVCLIQEGSEIGPAKVHGVGTVAEIGDWSRGEDGLLNILARGQQRFRLDSMHTQADGLNLGDVQLLPPDPKVEVPVTLGMLPELLRQILQQLEMDEPGLDYGDAAWVGNRLAEVLPISLMQRQYLLEMADPVKRLEILNTLVQSLATAV